MHIIIYLYKVYYKSANTAATKILLSTYEGRLVDYFHHVDSCHEGVGIITGTKVKKQ